MTDIARREIAHIPDWPYHQRILRMCYFNNRMHSLGRKSTYPDNPLEILKISIRDARRSEDIRAGTKFEYDEAFFEAESRKKRGK